MRLMTSFDENFRQQELEIKTQLHTSYHSKATGASIEPKAQHIVNSGSDVGVFPVEIRLFWREEREEIFLFPR